VPSVINSLLSSLPLDDFDKDTVDIAVLANRQALQRKTDKYAKIKKRNTFLSLEGKVSDSPVGTPILSENS
jgi:hypothetical protein